MNDRYLHPQNDIILFYFETITASYQHLDQWLIWWMINISIIKMKLSFFYFEWIISIIPAPWSMTDTMNDRYILPQNQIIFFYFETITASFKYLSSIFQALFKFTSTFHSTDFSSNFFWPYPHTSTIPAVQQTKFL